MFFELSTVFRITLNNLNHCNYIFNTKSILLSSLRSHGTFRNRVTDNQAWNYSLRRIHIHRASGPRFVSFPRDLLKRTNVREVVTSGRQSTGDGRGKRRTTVSRIYPIFLRSHVILLFAGEILQRLHSRRQLNCPDRIEPCPARVEAKLDFL